MEKLRKKDAERGETELHLSQEQKEEIARLRQFRKAKVAEREILHQVEMRKARATGEPEAVRSVEENYGRDLSRIEEETESKIDAVRRGGGSSA